jgi:hypothetical protein
LKPYDEGPPASDVYFNQYGVNIEHSINVFFPELLRDDGTPNREISGNGFGVNGEERNCVSLCGYYYLYITAAATWRQAFAFTAAHELGHALGLIHTHGPDELSDTYYPDVGGWCSCYENVNCSNNIMSYARIRSWFSPRQMGKMRRLMTVGWRAKVVDNCLLDEPMVTVTGNQTWDRPRLFSSDVGISNGASVTLQCKAYLPQQKEIIVEENSKLIIDGGSILNVCNEAVNIQVNEGGYLEITGSAVLDNCTVNVHARGSLKLSGDVVLKNGSSINLFSDNYFCFLPGINLNLIDGNTSFNYYCSYNMGINASYFPELSDGNCIYYHR